MFSRRVPMVLTLWLASDRASMGSLWAFASAFLPTLTAIVASLAPRLVLGEDEVLDLDAGGGVARGQGDRPLEPVPRDLDGQLVLRAGEHGERFGDGELHGRVEPGGREEVQDELAQQQHAEQAA